MNRLIDEYRNGGAHDHLIPLPVCARCVDEVVGTREHPGMLSGIVSWKPSLQSSPDTVLDSQAGQEEDTTQLGESFYITGHPMVAKIYYITSEHMFAGGDPRIRAGEAPTDVFRVGISERSLKTLEREMRRTPFTWSMPDDGLRITGSINGHIRFIFKMLNPPYLDTAVEIDSSSAEDFRGAVTRLAHPSTRL